MALNVGLTLISELEKKFESGFNLRSEDVPTASAQKWLTGVWSGLNVNAVQLLPPPGLSPEGGGREGGGREPGPDSNTD